MCPYSKTVDGFELQLGVNHLGKSCLSLQSLPWFEISCSCTFFGTRSRYEIKWFDWLWCLIKLLRFGNYQTYFWEMLLTGCTTPVQPNWLTHHPGKWTRVTVFFKLSVFSLYWTMASFQMIISSVVFLSQADRDKNMLCSSTVTHTRMGAHSTIYKYTCTFTNILYMWTCMLDNDNFW